MRKSLTQVANATFGASSLRSKHPEKYVLKKQYCHQKKALSLADLLITFSFIVILVFANLPVVKEYVIEDLVASNAKTLCINFNRVLLRAQLAFDDLKNVKFENDDGLYIRY